MVVVVVSSVLSVNKLNFIASLVVGTAVVEVVDAVEDFSSSLCEAC